jgi:hypothetical protein
MTRSQAIAEELRKVIRLAGRDPEALEGELPALSALYRVAAAGELDEPARVHFILHRLIPEYATRLPAGRDCQAIRELLTWEDSDGDHQSLTTRYHQAAAHLVSPASDFGRRQEPRLLLECARRFLALDHEDRLARSSVIDADGTAPVGVVENKAPGGALAGDDAPAGIARVHPSLDYCLLVDLMGDAGKIVILNTWIPELNILADALVEALRRGTHLSILMLYPESHIAQLRSQALQGSTQARFREDHVRPGVRHCLEVLEAIGHTVGEDLRRHLRVRLYNSLPSISVFAFDDRALVSVFLHGQLAVKSVQIEVHGRDSVMGQLVFGELDTLWQMGQEFNDVTQWQSEMESMSQRFGIAS